MPLKFSQIVIFQLVLLEKILLLLNISNDPCENNNNNMFKNTEEAHTDLIQSEEAKGQFCFG